MDTIGITTRVMARYGAFLLYFKDGGRKKRKRLLFTLYFLLPDLLFYIPLHSNHISINVESQSVFFQMVPRICISLLQELQAVRFGYVVVGEKFLPHSVLYRSTRPTDGANCFKGGMIVVGALGCQDCVALANCLHGSQVK